ncbi:concanavalin A-like lectin/glucanase domain-containing protein [Lentinula aciculospora]|uniref:Concanavalin A-like lectin/glucanase domain-containing protein n=1 Tax=Lentinula aciculospora TaxID=153920 RepID=A0A9W8ZYU8_9AGAR|nr:concanavalin A-like lectin/glucanase domain-containing protein [Lentinula aciculospora]
MAKPNLVTLYKSSLILPYALLLLCSWFVTAIYTPIREYSGTDFFSEWDYYGFIDNTTWGNVNYVDENTGTSQGLTYIDSTTGHAIIRVDNTTNIPTATTVNRNSVKITTKDAYPIGSLVVIDVWHIPYGCSVWPSFWMLGTNLLWPNSGEIDIIESINNLPSNQYALHTTPGCFLPSNPSNSALVQSGNTISTNCSTGQGCVVGEMKPNSFGSGFAQAGGGVFATQLDVSGIYMWFWQRSSIPTSISQADSSSLMNLTDWGAPTAAFISSACNITQYFQPQQLILDITLCGVWAGVPSIYNATGCSGQCIDNVIGSGNPIYNDAYWDISYIRTYLANSITTETSGSGNGNSSSISSSTASFTSSSSLSPSSSSLSGNGNSATSNPTVSQWLLRSMFLLIGLGSWTFC